ARAHGPAAVVAVAVGVVGVRVGPVRRQLVRAVVAVGDAGAVDPLAGEHAPRVVAVGVGGQGRARAVGVVESGHPADRVVQVRGGPHVDAAGQVAVARLGVQQAVALVGQVNAHCGGADTAELAHVHAVVGVIGRCLDAAGAVLYLGAVAHRVVGKG